MAKTATKKKKRTTKKKGTSASNKNKTLIVVESPAKAKTINKYLGSKFIVEASVGHIKDLIKVRLGVDVDNGFEPKYTTIKGKGDVIKRLKQLASNSKDVLIATDPDREGEAIAWHIAAEVKDKNENIRRVLFNEITKAGIEKGIKDPVSINENLFMSQQARRVMDRLIGYKVSPFLSRAMLEKTTKALSAGRVQSVALRLICERENDIRAFEPFEYWTINGDFRIGKEDLKAKLVSFDGNMIKNPEGSASGRTEEENKEIQKKMKGWHFIPDKNSAEEIAARIKKEDYKIDDIQKKKVKRRPSPPFTTSLLQQEASKRLGFSNKKTMMIAQRLYEGVKLGKEGEAGLITYMRTDSVRISPDAQKAAKDFIKGNYGDNYLPEKPNFYKSKASNIQDAHEAIRPTSMEYDPKFVSKYLSKDEAKLYELIFNRFIASQMAPAVIDQTTIELKGGDFVFRATGSIIVFKGFLKVYDDFNENTDNGKGRRDSTAILPENLKKGDDADLKDTEKIQSFTKPKPRFTEASLVKELDELGIGRPSTYAQIVSTIIDREYVELQKKSFAPTELGEDVNDVLVKNFPDLFNVEFTAEMEDELDTIAEGKKAYEEMLNDFYNPFQKSLKHAEEHGDIPEIPCPECGAPMIIRVSRRGRFLGCSRYPDCTGTQPLPKPESEKEEEKTVIAEGVECPECGDKMAVRQGKFGRFYGCVNYPECKGILPITTGVECPTCHEGELVERYSPKAKKRFWGCSKYPDCKHITNYEPVDKKCPNCDHYFIEIRYRKVDDGYEKYVKCPNCKENYEIDLVEDKVSGQ